MAKTTKAKTKLKAVKDTDVAEAVAAAPTSELNEFENPSAALVQGSEMQLAVLDGNEIEAPQGEEVEADPFADEARSRLKKVLSVQDDNFFDIAKDMSYIANKKSYNQWGYKTFEAFLDAEFNLSKRKGQYYVQVYNYVESTLRTNLKDRDGDYNALRDAIRDAGWGKGRVLAREQIVTTDNVLEVIEKLKTSSYREFETYCKAARSSMSDKDRENADDNNDVKTVRIAFQCSLPQKDDVEAAVELATTMIGKETTRSAAIAWAARDFVSTNVAAQGKDRAEAVAELLSKYERLFGISIIAIDDQTQQCVFGQESLEKFSK